MTFEKDELLSSFSRMHGKYEFTRKQARVLDEYMDDMCTMCMLDTIKEWDAEPALV